MSEIIVKIKQGSLRGKTVEDVKGGKHFAFLGIPYAKPPVDKLRFKAPQPAENWEGIRDALEEGSPCKSKHSEKQTVQGEEDCLFLNVYTPQLPNLSSGKKPLPVMVWIHGGGFHQGSSTASTYGPFFILTENVVFVSINYRLGIFGFLSLEDPSLEIPGNAGLKDQRLALKWVQENISAFGGDPNNVTIFGESAGAGSVHFHILSPSCKGLFHKAILQSGVAINPWAISDNKSGEIAEALGISGASEKVIYKELMTKTSDELHAIQESLPYFLEPRCKCPWVPVVEKPSADAFLTEDPINLVKTGNFNKTPTLLGYASREGMLCAAFAAHLGQSLVINDMETQIPHWFNLPKGSPESKKVAEEIKKFYFGDEEPSMENLDQGLHLNGDACFVRGIQKVAEYTKKFSSHPVYFYRFSIDAGLNFLKARLLKLNFRGACHADDLGYIFHSEWTPKIIPNTTEDIIQRSIVHLWANFAKYGDPNVNADKNLIKVEWKPVDKDNLNYLDIGENLTVGKNPDRERMAFWDKCVSLFEQSRDY